MTTALVVENDVDLLDLLSYSLRRDGYAVYAAVDGIQALDHYANHSPDIILLDINIPGIDGYEVCRRIRLDDITPIIILTARDDEDDILRGLQLGADDYVPKPFSVKLLLARMKNVLRRANPDGAPEPKRTVVVRDLVLDLQSHEVTKGGRQIRLTTLEFKISYFLALNAGRVIPYSRLVEYAWGYDGGDSSLLKTHICHIRQKLGFKPNEPGGINVVPGVGYSLDRIATKQD